MQDTTPEMVGFRLSPQQEHLLAAGAEPGTVGCAVLLEGPLDADRLREALVETAGRHEILRTTFAQPAGMRMPQQMIAEQLAPSWSTLDLGADDLLRDRTALSELLEREAREPIDLEHGPLVRALLVGGQPGPGLLVLTASAACADAASLVVLLDELTRAYGGHDPDGEPIQYADYAEWRHELIADEEAEQGRAFWREDAEDRPEPPRILFGRWPSTSSSASDTVVVELAEVDVQALRDAATSAGVSAPLFLEAAWHALLARISGAGELLTAGWVDGRAQPDLERAVGPYSQPTPIRSRAQAQTTFAEVLDQVRRSRATASRWQDCATGEDLAALTSHARIGFSHLAVPVATSPVLQIVALGAWRAPAGLVLSICSDEAELHGEISFDPAALERDDAEELAERYAILLGSAIADPSQPVTQMAMMDGAERTQLIAAADGASAGVPARASVPVHVQFQEQAARTPDLIAVDSPAGRLSYGQLNAAANQLAHHLRSAGSEPGVPVGLCMERTPSMLVALLAILKQGGGYLPLNFEHPKARLAHQLTESRARVLITEEHLLERLPDFDGTIVCVDRDSDAIAARPDGDLDQPVKPEDLVYVMYTSGSTGLPKGVAVTHGNLAAYAGAIVERLGAGDEVPLAGLRFGVVSAISTDLGNTSIFTPLISGGCVQLVSAEASMDSDALAAELGGNSLDVLKITPSHLRALLTGEANAAVPRRWLLLGGEALTWDLVEQVRARASDCRVINHYGPTETTVGCCTYLAEGNPRTDSLTVPIGFPLPGARAYVLDEHLEPVPAGVPGELCIGGVGVARGYVGGSGAERFAPDPFAAVADARMYRTGDQARRLRDGALEFLGRLDEQVKIRGFRIELGEIEAALAAHPAIRQVAVSAESDGKATPRLVAYIVSTEPPAVEELEAFLAESLPDYMVPSAFATVEALPFTPSGKIDRKALPGLAEVQTRMAAEYVAPRDEIEAEIAGIWGELLGVERVGVLDDFFALGGHSLLATQAIMRIRRQHGDIPLRALLAAPTVASLAEVVRGGADAGT